MKFVKRDYWDEPCPKNDGSHEMEMARAGTVKGEPATVLRCRHCQQSSKVLFNAWREGR